MYKIDKDKIIEIITEESIVEENIILDEDPDIEYGYRRKKAKNVFLGIPDEIDDKFKEPIEKFLNSGEIIDFEIEGFSIQHLIDNREIKIYEERKSKTKHFFAALMTLVKLDGATDGEISRLKNIMKMNLKRARLIECRINLKKYDKYK